MILCLDTTFVQKVAPQRPMHLGDTRPFHFYTQDSTLSNKKAFVPRDNNEGLNLEDTSKTLELI